MIPDWPSRGRHLPGSVAGDRLQGDHPLFSGSGIDCVIVGGLAATMRGVRRTSTPSPSWKRSSRSAATIRTNSPPPVPSNPHYDEGACGRHRPVLPAVHHRTGHRTTRSRAALSSIPSEAAVPERRNAFPATPDSPPPVRRNHRSRNTTLPLPAKRDRHIASAPAENRRRIADRDSCGRASMRPRGIPRGKRALAAGRKPGTMRLQ